MILFQIWIFFFCISSSSLTGNIPKTASFTSARPLKCLNLLPSVFVTFQLHSSISPKTWWNWDYSNNTLPLKVECVCADTVGHHLTELPVLRQKNYFWYLWLSPGLIGLVLIIALCFTVLLLGGCREMAHRPQTLSVWHSPARNERVPRPLVLAPTSQVLSEAVSYSLLMRLPYWLHLHTCCYLTALPQFEVNQDINYRNLS